MILTLTSDILESVLLQLMVLVLVMVNVNLHSAIGTKSLMR